MAKTVFLYEEQLVCNKTCSESTVIGPLYVEECAVQAKGGQGKALLL